MPRIPRASPAHSPSRFAIPFHPAASPPPTRGLPSITEWSKKQLGPVPAGKGNGTIDLADIIGAAGTKEIEQLGEIRFHSLGDSGHGTADEAEKVAEEMATDYKPGAGALNPAFLFHLGDVIYGADKGRNYGERFYRPYRHYPGKIIAIPGNHDGEVKSPVDSPSLKDFQANFCAPTATVPDQAASSGIFRETMTLPGVYWLLEAPFLRIIGLYSNLLENPGYLEGKTTAGKGDSSQLDWLKTTLQAIAQKKDGKALVIATHHPPFSQSGHSGSTEMSQSIDDVCQASKVVPDLFLAGHAHNYQRYTRRMGGKEVPYLVIGTGGMPVQPVLPATGQPADKSHQTTYDKAVSSLGYLFVSVTAKQLKTEFWELGQEHITPFDALTLDLATKSVK